MAHKVYIISYADHVFNKKTTLLNYSMTRSEFRNGSFIDLTLEKGRVML